MCADTKQHVSTFVQKIVVGKQTLGTLLNFVRSLQISGNNNQPIVQLLRKHVQITHFILAICSNCEYQFGQYASSCNIPKESLRYTYCAKTSKH